MKRYKSIEAKSIKLELYEGDVMYFVIHDNKVVCTSKYLDSVLYYFDMVYNEHLKTQN